MELFQANRQWSSRPADERFVSLIDLANHCDAVKLNSKSRTMSSRAIEARPVEGDHRALVLVGPNGAPVTPTHWSFGQLAQRAGAPAGYLRAIPAELAADCINYGLQHSREIEDVGILLRKDESALVPTLAALTGPNYGRIWNSTITKGLVDRFGDGLTGEWRVPGEFGREVPITKENTTLYASDRDMFVFLADERHSFELKGRRDGQAGQMSRGFFLWNSEVGAKTFGIATFLFDYVCKNRIVWGATEYAEINIRHTASAPDKWIQEVTPALQSYSNASTGGIVKAIEASREKRIDDIDEFLTKRFTKTQAKAIQAVHLQEEQRPIETLWDAVTGATAYARGVQYQDDRVDLERAAGKILDLTAA